MKHIAFIVFFFIFVYSTKMESTTVVIIQTFVFQFRLRRGNHPVLFEQEQSFYLVISTSYIDCLVDRELRY